MRVGTAEAPPDECDRLLVAVEQVGEAVRYFSGGAFARPLVAAEAPAVRAVTTSG